MTTTYNTATSEQRSFAYSEVVDRVAGTIIKEAAELPRETQAPRIALDMRRLADMRFSNLQTNMAAVGELIARLENLNPHEYDPTVCHTLSSVALESIMASGFEGSIDAELQGRGAHHLSELLNLVKLKSLLAS